MNQGNDLVERVTELFKANSPPNEGDKLTNYLAHIGFFNTYLALVKSGMQGTFTPHPYLPDEFRPFLEGLSVDSLTREELDKNTLSRIGVREDFAKRAKKNPKWFAEVITKLFSYENNPFKDPENGVTREDLPYEERFHAEITARLALEIVPELWRDVSLSMVGPGKYLIGFEPSWKAISKRMREAPDNPMAFNEAQIRWRNLGRHAISFFDLQSLDRLIQDGDAFGDASLVQGYPWIADADKHGYQQLRFGYEHHERRNPILHQFPLVGDGSRKQKTYREGQSIASITIVDLLNPHKGLEYVMRHIDGTIAVGKVFLRQEDGRFIITHSNHVMYITENPESVNDPIFGVALLVSAMGRDMMAYNHKERDYRVGHGMQKPSDGTSPEPVEIWLPQTIYSYNTDPRKAHSEHHRLAGIVREIGPHYRSPHKMHLPPYRSPSQEALGRAIKDEYPLPPGNYTYVKGHPVMGGNKNMVQQFRSHSAMAYLFNARKVA